MLAAAHNGDLMAARGVGFQCAFIPRPTEYGPAQDMDLQAENDYEIVAADFSADDKTALFHDTAAGFYRIGENQDD